MEIFNLKQQLESVTNHSNQDELLVLEREFQRKHYPNVLSKSKQLREKNEKDKDLCKVLLLLESVCHAEINEFRQSTEIILDLYQKERHASIDDLFLLGELAFMSDYKLSRRIMSSVIKKMEAEDDTDLLKMARGYLVLGEAEENLEKHLRAIKYYEKGLMFYQEQDPENKQMPLFLHFKIGMLKSTVNQAEEAISHLKKSILYADNDPQLKINSLVSIAKIYSSQDKVEEAFPYLKEALSVLDDSPDIESIVVRAEANTEMAYYYFNKEMYKEAIPYYKESIPLQHERPDQSPSTLGMLYMQYAYCLELQGESEKGRTIVNYEKAISQLERTGNHELLESALMSVIEFFDKINHNRKKKTYENKLMNLVNRTQIS